MGYLGVAIFFCCSCEFVTAVDFLSEGNKFLVEMCICKILTILLSKIYRDETIDLMFYLSIGLFKCSREE